MKHLLLLFMGFSTLALYSQGHIDHIKNQSYLKYKGSVDCESPDGLSQRICANLEFQRQDSVLTIYYGAVGKLWDPVKLDSLQKKWRAFRDEHCELAYNQYEGGAGNLKYVVYLKCLTELTNHRIEELQRVLEND